MEELTSATTRTRCKHINKKIYINICKRHLTKQEGCGSARRTDNPPRKTFPHLENCFHLPQIIKRRTGRREKRRDQIKICCAQSFLARTTSVFLYVNSQIQTDQWTLQRSVQYLAYPKALLKQLFYLNYHSQLYEYSKNSLFYIRKKKGESRVWLL